MTGTSISITRVDLGSSTHCRAVLDLLNQYASSTAGRGSPLAPEVLQQLPTVLQHQPHYRGWLAWTDAATTEAIGLINAFCGVSTFRAMPLLNIHDIFVRPDWQNRGVAKQMLAEAERVARQEGCCKLTLEVLEHNAPAMAAYRGFGFDPYVLDPALGSAVFLEKKL